MPPLRCLRRLADTSLAAAASTTATLAAAAATAKAAMIASFTADAAAVPAAAASIVAAAAAAAAAATSAADACVGCRISRCFCAVCTWSTRARRVREPRATCTAACAGQKPPLRTVAMRGWLGPVLSLGRELGGTNKYVSLLSSCLSLLIWRGQCVLWSLDTVSSTCL